MSRTLAAAALLLVLVSGVGAADPPAAESETAYLFGFVEGSGCTFYRNGTAYDAVRAAAHLREKYGAMRTAGTVMSAEQFIDKVATRSSMTGWPYEVLCSGAQRLAAADWLREALRRHRAGEASRQARDAR